MAEGPSARDQIELLIHVRRRRRQFFPAWMFGGEGAWDILLELYRAGLQNRNVSTADVAMAVGASSSVAVRWIRALEDGRFVSRTRIPGGAELISLSDEGRSAMDRFVASLASDLSPA